MTIDRGLREWTDHALKLDDGRKLIADLVIDTSRGASERVARMDSPLIQDLLSSGIAISDPFGGVRVERGSWRLLSRSGDRHNIYAVGSLAQGARYYVNALDSIVRSVGDVMEAIAP
ncbi:hypothetical protein JCM13591A_15960 [Microbacterium xylanilyticum]